jgi:hypothetical protein
MIAMTPSLNASSLFLPIGPPGKNKVNKFYILNTAMNSQFYELKGDFSLTSEN